MTYAYSSQQTSANLPAGKSKFSAAAAHKFPSADMNTHPKDAGSVQAPAPTKATKSFHCVSCKFTLNNKTNNTRTPIKIKMCSDAAGREKNKRRCELLKGIEYDSTKAYTEDVKTFKNTHCLFLNTELKYSGQEEKNKHLCQSTWQKIDQKEKKATFRPRTTTSTPKNRRVIVKCLPDPKRAKNAAQLAKVYEVSASEQDAPRACGRGRYMGHIVLNR